MKLVVIESPYAGNIDNNTRYFNECMIDCFKRGEAPFGSHGIYPNVLNENSPCGRKLGIESGYAWGEKADIVAVYQDFGISSGMQKAIEYYMELGKFIEYRRLYENETKTSD